MASNAATRHSCAAHASTSTSAVVEMSMRSPRTQPNANIKDPIFQQW
jgi:hypothetical protein